jgi:hypothetical protein
LEYAAIQEVLVVSESPSEYNSIVDCEHEHRDAEHEHEEGPEQSDADEGLDRPFLTCAKVNSSPTLISNVILCRQKNGVPTWSMNYSRTQFRS